MDGPEPVTQTRDEIPTKDISLTFMKGMTVLRAFD